MLCWALSLCQDKCVHCSQSKAVLKLQRMMWDFLPLKGSPALTEDVVLRKTLLALFYKLLFFFFFWLFGHCKVIEIILQKKKVLITKQIIFSMLVCLYLKEWGCREGLGMWIGVWNVWITPFAIWSLLSFIFSVIEKKIVITSRWTSVLMNDRWKGTCSTFLLMHWLILNFDSSLTAQQ